ncbi:MAG: hypothetical protein Q8O61_12905 [Nocardioides sp.]|nr:hypothetical protein [Nocardioides sp.]
MAAGLFTLVMWTGVIDTFVRGHLVLRIVAVLVAACGSTAMIWSAVPGWYLLPLVWSVLAAVSTRAKTWIVTAGLAAVYASGLVWLLL